MKPVWDEGLVTLSRSMKGVTGRPSNFSISLWEKIDDTVGITGYYIIKLQDGALQGFELHPQKYKCFRSHFSRVEAENLTKSFNILLILKALVDEFKMY